MAKQFDALWDSLPTDARLTLLYQHFREQEKRITDVEGAVGDTKAALGTIQGSLAPISHNFADLMKWVEESREERERRKDADVRTTRRVSVARNSALAMFPVIVALFLAIHRAYPLIAICGISAVSAALLMIVGMSVARA